MSESQPIFTFGVIADIQYADKDETWMEDRNQRYREAVSKFTVAAEDFLGHDPLLSFVLTLGDIVDGNSSLDKTLEDLQQVAAVIDRLSDRIPVHHVVGNHCLSVPRDYLLGRLHIPATSYYSVQLVEGWRLLALDTTEMSPHSGYPEDHPSSVECQAYQASHPKQDYPQMSDWNGGVSSTQLAWLRAELAAAETAGERVIVASHHPIGKGCGRPTHMAWNADEVEAALLQSKAFVLAFNGHDHPGGYANTDGRHFVGVEAVLEAPADSTAYAFVKVFPDRLVIEGRGTVTSRTLQMPQQ